MLKNLFGFYMASPFIAGFLEHILIDSKNKITFRFITKLICIINFFICSFLFFSNTEKSISIFGAGFLINRTTLLFLLFNSIMFLLFSLLSKTFIQKFSKIFYLIFLIHLGTTNLFLFSDNIIATFGCLFVIFLLNYLSVVTYAKTDEIKKEAKIQFAYDFALLFFALFLILFDFARYFVLNNTEFTYSNIKNYLPFTAPEAQIEAFIGFLILAFRLFNISGGYGFIKQTDKTNNFALLIKVSCDVLLGGYYFINVYNNFDFLFFKYQNYIVLFLMSAVLYNIILSLRKDNILKSIYFLFFANTAFSMSAFFAFDEFAPSLFMYYLFSTIFSYMFCIFIFLLQKKKTKTLDFDKIKCGLVKNRNVQFMTLYSLINISFAPGAAMFIVIVLLNIHMFTIRYEASCLNYFIYILPLGFFISSLSIYNLIYKILIEPSKKSFVEINFAFHQRFCIILVIFLNILFGIFGINLLNNIVG